MPQYRTRLTTKQSIFVKEYVANSYNATKAVQSAYSTHSYGSARVMGSKLLTNTNVQSAIEAELIRHGITADTMTQTHKRLLCSNDKRVALDALKLAYRVYGELER